MCCYGSACTSVPAPCQMTGVTARVAPVSHQKTVWQRKHQLPRTQSRTLRTQSQSLLHQSRNRHASVAARAFRRAARCVATAAAAPVSLSLPLLLLHAPQRNLSICQDRIIIIPGISWTYLVVPQRNALLRPRRAYAHTVDTYCCNGPGEMLSINRDMQARKLRTGATLHLCSMLLCAALADRGLCHVQEAASVEDRAQSDHVVSVSSLCSGALSSCHIPAHARVRIHVHSLCIGFEMQTSAIALLSAARHHRRAAQREHCRVAQSLLCRKHAALAP